MKLELKHIAPYLPYGVKCQAMGERVDNDDDESPAKISTVSGIYTDSYGEVFIEAMYDGDKFDIFFETDFFPILLPMSDLYKPLDNGNMPLVELTKIAYANHKDFRLVKDRVELTSGGLTFYKFYWYDNGFVTIYSPDGIGRIIPNQLQLFEYLFEHHFDVYGLIEKGLAIDINTLKE